MLVAVLVGLVAGLVLAIILTPRVVEYVETIEIGARPELIYDAIRQQGDLMRWSAWPSETGSDCAVEGLDGDVGARTVFLNKKGDRFGYQEVTALSAPHKVSFVLQSKGPPHTPSMDFYMVEVANNRTQVLLHFRNEIAPPFHLGLRIADVVRWTRMMHGKDLHGLKRFLEQGVDYQGQALRPAA
ncbi:MAG: hypothetical protein AAF527_08965 [Pseudomonadota bacterium]